MHDSRLPPRNSRQFGFLTLEDWTDNFSRNFGMEFSTTRCVKQPRRTLFANETVIRVMHDSRLPTRNSRQFGFSTLEDWTDNSSRNVGMEFSTTRCVKQPRRTQFSNETIIRMMHDSRLPTLNSR